MPHNYGTDPRYGAQVYHQQMPNYAQQPKQQQQSHQTQQYRQPAYQETNKYYAGKWGLLPVAARLSDTPRTGVPQQKAQSMGRCFRAMYDYVAQDIDEVSFIDGDLIINCQPIDDGWMNGTVQRTGETGMLPSNYLESA